jgi:hypothetical protein
VADFHRALRCLLRHYGVQQPPRNSSSNRYIRPAFHESAEEAEQLSRKIFPAGDEGSFLVKTSSDSGDALLGMVHFSDSTIAVTKDDSDASSLAIELACTKLFVNTLRRKVLLRGAIARGFVTADFEHAIFFGKPIADAYHLEQSQLWFGISEDESCNQHPLPGVLCLPHAPSGVRLFSTSAQRQARRYTIHGAVKAGS